MSWLSRWLAIDVTPGNGYAILRGLHREYVYYPAAGDAGKPKPLHALRQYLLTRMLLGSHPYNKSELTIEGEIQLSLNGKRLDPSTETVEWGATYDFEVPDDFAEAFSAEESWLPGASEECNICIEGKKLSDMAIKVTSHCEHRAAVCKDCLQRWLQESVEGGSWPRANCPVCEALLDWHDFKRCASKETFERYDKLLLRRTLARDPTFQWCLSPTCESGQMHEKPCPEFRCVACHKEYCIEHRVRWHTGETCRQYDERHRLRKSAYEASGEFVRTSTQTCPDCKRPILKDGGCNRITCKLPPHPFHAHQPRP
jgi:hypothetical protein